MRQRGGLPLVRLIRPKDAADETAVNFFRQTSPYCSFL